MDIDKQDAGVMLDMLGERLEQVGEQVERTLHSAYTTQTSNMKREAKQEMLDEYRALLLELYDELALIQGAYDILMDIVEKDMHD